MKNSKNNSRYTLRHVELIKTNILIIIWARFFSIAGGSVGVCNFASALGTVENEYVDEVKHS